MQTTTNIPFYDPSDMDSTFVYDELIPTSDYICDLSVEAIIVNSEGCGA